MRVTFLVSYLDELASLRVRRKPAQAGFQAALDVVDRIVDFVCQLCSEFSRCREPLARKQFLLCLLQLLECLVKIPVTGDQILIEPAQLADLFLQRPAHVAKTLREKLSSSVRSPQ